MKGLRISKSKDYFTKNGEPFFYLADTVWSAFYTTAIRDWEEYLDYRKLQGFNVLQISVLPIIHDLSESNINISPFHLKENGKYNYNCINEEYFSRACKMLDLAKEKGFIPAIVPLWYCYAVSENTPENVMPLDYVKPYIEYIVETFKKYNPVYLVTGDTWFKEEEYEHYRIEIATIKTLSPDSLTAIHLNTHVFIPDEFIYSPDVDIILYQSGHSVDNGIETQELSYKYAKHYYSIPVKRPIANGEICYEGSGYGYAYGRFKEFDIRKATWQSLLSGAKAGVAYGAHGVWSWHEKGKAFSSEDFISMPYSWRTALKFKGAWDVSYARWIFETYELFDIEPLDCIKNETEEIRASATKDLRKIVIYMPYSVDIYLNLNLERNDWIIINLEDRYVSRPEISTKDGFTVIKMHDFNSDVLILGL